MLPKPHLHIVFHRVSGHDRCVPPVGLLYPHELMVLAAALAAPAWLAAQQRDVWGPWDYGTLVVPFVVWVGLSLPKFGYRDLATRPEPFVMAASIPTTLSVRVFLLDQWVGYPEAMSIAVFTTCTFLAVGLWWEGLRRG